MDEWGHGSHPWGSAVTGRHLGVARSQWDAAVRLAVLITLLAVPVAAVAGAVGAGGATLGVAVILIGFSTSWVQSGRIERAAHVRAVSSRIG